jgi:metal-responsive CopG/Arc/MetJ family transcriptional regulator
MRNTFRVILVGYINELMKTYLRCKVVRIITFKVDEVLLEEVDRIAKVFRKSRSEIIRSALHTYIKHLKTSKKDNVNIKEITLT